MNSVIAKGEMARIFLKDGNQKMGLLLNDINHENAFDEGVKYIPHNNIENWLQSFSQEFVHVLKAESVDEIDLIMK